MFLFFTLITLITLVFAQDCTTSCDTYLTERQSLHDLNINVATLGTTLGPNVINYMCQAYSDSVYACAKCTYEHTGGFTDPTAIDLVYGWQAVCETSSHVGVDQAILCWAALPNDTSKCWMPSSASSVSSMFSSGSMPTSSSPATISMSQTSSGGSPTTSTTSQTSSMSGKV